MARTSYCGLSPSCPPAPWPWSARTWLGGTWRPTGTGATQHSPIRPTLMSYRATPVQWVSFLTLHSAVSTDLSDISVHPTGLGLHHPCWMWESQELQWEGYCGGLLLSKGKRSWQISFECCSASWDFGKYLNYINSHLSPVQKYFHLVKMLSHK